MDIDRVIVERQDGMSFCGVLSYEHGDKHQMLTWSFERTPDNKVVLLLFPASANGHYPEVQVYYRELADAILDAILQAASR
ncbi:hypothetical protein J7643_16850 [bacterium]|nr:hypothetical protein [bacterium]